MAQNHQIKMSLMFDVNASKAKTSLQDLQKSLNGLTSSMGKGDLKLTADVQGAYVAAEKLKRVLNESVNMNTGQFDLSKFQSQLKQSGMSVQSLSADFAKAGSQGVQAFNSLASAVTNAEIPTKRMHKVLDQMVKSFKDTMRWQISSSAVHGLTGALQSAYGYAQDLNKSLNDIRIVTGYSEEHMARFAKEANNAAKALSSTTNEYAKAALIFYQQGTLTDDQITQRTDATIKMANVTGETAKDISSYMTAIWNNFEDGTKSLEYYADVITALGAATASSSAEIATGMQKFAAIGKTVGLSYDYAASALATVVAATRQSEDTVGTSFKTIFSRLQSLSLGETLDDETTLSKYSAALAKVGIDIKLSNGELKQMDDIIDELGNKWAQLSQEQKTALSYTVAGSRQYTNFISLMDNYETFKINVDIATDAEGTLDEQQKIYAESWEAAANRVRAAAEGIFQDLIDDKFFINLLNGAEKLISMLDLFMDSIGGLPGILSLVSSLMLRIFSSQVTQSVRDIGYGLSHFLGIAQAKAGKTKTDFAEQAQQLTKKMRVDTVGDPMLNADLDSMSHRIQLEQEYIALESTLTDRQKEQYQIQLSLLDIMREQKKEKLEAMEVAKEEMHKAGIATVKGASIMSQDEFMPAAKEAWTQEHMGKLSDASAAEAAARETAQSAFDSVAGRQAQVDAERKALGAAITKRDELKAASKSKGADFDNIGKGQSGAIDEADKQLTGEYQAAEKLVRALETQLAQAESNLATAQGEARAAQGAFYEALTAKMEIASEEMPEFNPVAQNKIGETLTKYIAYSTGRNDMLEKGIVDMLSGLGEISREGMTEEEYKKRLDDIAIKLRDFQDDYYIELGENTQEVIDSIIEQLETNWNEEGADISSEDIQKFTDRITAAREVDVKKYRTGTTGKDGRVGKQGTAADIRAAMEKEQGVVLDDATFTEFEEGYQKYAKAVREVRRTTDKELEGIKNAYGELNEPPTKLYDFADRITGIAQGVSNLSLAFNSVKGAWDAISNPDLSGWEKFMAVFTALSTVVGSVMSTMQLLSKLKTGVNEKTAKETLITWLNTVAQKANAKARKEGAAAADWQGNEIKEVTREKQKEIVTDIAGEGVEKVTGANGKVPGTGGSTLGAGGAQSLKTAFQSALPTLGPIAGGIAAIVASVLLLTAAITITVKGYNAARDAAKKAAETAQLFSKVATEAQQKYNNTVETISSYKEALAGMKELTKGTEEWNKALLETNKTAFDLINQFSGLAGKYRFENGQVVFDEGALEEAQAAQLVAAQDAQAASMAANIAARKAEANADKLDMARDLNSSGDVWKKLGNAAAATGVAAGSGALAGSAVGAVAGVGAFSWATTGVGAVIGAVAGLTAGVVAATQDLTSTVDELDAMDELVTLYSKNPSAFETKDGFIEALSTTSISLEDSDLIDSLVENREELSKTVEALYANEEATKIATQAMVSGANADNDDYANSEYKDYLNIFGQQSIDENAAKRARVEAEVKELWKGSNTKKGGFWDTYLKEMFGEDADQYRIKDAGGGNVTLQKKNEYGTWETQGEKNSLNEKAAQATLVEKRMAKLEDEEIEEAEKKAEQIESSLEEAGLSSEAVRAAGLAFFNNKAIDLSDLTGAELEKINVELIDDEKLRDAMNTAVKNANDSWGTMLSKYSDTVVREIGEFDRVVSEKGYEVTREQMDLYAEALTNFSTVAGENSADGLNKNLTALLTTHEDKAEEIIDLATSIDWTNPENLHQFNAGLADMGIAVDAFSWEIDDAGTKLGDLQLSANLFRDLEQAEQQLASIGELASKIKPGAAISAEDYANLSDNEFRAWNTSDFVKRLDGSYTYVGKDKGAQAQFNTAQRAITATAKQYFADQANEIEAQDDLELDELKQKATELTGMAYSLEALENLENSIFGDYINDIVLEKMRDSLQDEHKLRIASLDTAEDIARAEEKITKELDKQKDLLSEITGTGFIEAGDKYRGLAQDKIRENNALLQDARRDNKSIQEQLRQKGYDLEIDNNGNILNYHDLRVQASQKEGSNTEGYDEIIQMIENLQNGEQAIAGYKDTIQENLDVISSYWSIMAEGVEKYGEEINFGIESTANVLNSYRNVIGLVGEDILHLTEQRLKDLNSYLQDTANAAYIANKNTYNMLVTARQGAEAQLQGLSGDALEKKKAEVLELQKQEQAAFEAMNNSFAASLEQAATNLQDNVSNILHSFEQGLAGIYGSFERMSEAYQQQSTISDQYLPDYKKVYELNKLSRNLQKQIDLTANVKAQNSLKELQEKINTMQASSVKMSEYDLEYMQKKYELRLAEIALEEAQNAKNQVRLQKMANGSWGYVYTQNEESVAKAQQDYEDKLYNLQELSANYLEEVSGQILSTQLEFEAAIQEIYNAGLEPAEQQRRIEETVNHYKEHLLYLTSEFDKTLENNRGMINTAQFFADTLLGSLYPEKSSAADIFTTFSEAIGNEKNGLISKLLEASNIYTDEVDNIFELSGTNIDKWTTTILNNAKKITDGVKQSVDAMSSFTQTAIVTWNDNKDLWDDNRDLGLSLTRKNTIDKILEGQQKKGINTWTEDELRAMNDTALKRAWNQAGAMSVVDLQDSGWYGNQKGFTRNEVIQMLKSVGHGYFNIYGDLTKLSDEKLKGLAGQAIGFGWLDRYTLENIMQGGWAAFDTGGYTGAWGPEGKLAVLHEKEIVLNATDTQNLLRIMEIMDQVIKNIDISASAAASSRLYSPGITSSNSTLQQQVTIHAEFPEATDRHEIEAAFDSLINRASQFANRNR